jgi:DNA replication protein DnaC
MLTEIEINNREENQLKRRLKKASFPVIKTLDNFDFTAIPNVNKNKILSLAEADFVREHENVLLVGNSGTGKTQIV